MALNRFESLGHLHLDKTERMPIHEGAEELESVRVLRAHTGEHEIAAILVANVSESLTINFPLNRLKLLVKLVKLGANDRNWYVRFLHLGHFILNF